MFQKNKKGFTLIELMVVIAIIAILATVVLVALNTARDAARDSNTKSAVAQIRSLADVEYAINLHYGGVAGVGDYTQNEEIDYLQENAEVEIVVHSNDSKEEPGWCAYAPLLTDSPGAYFCASKDTTPDVYKNFDASLCTETSFTCGNVGD